MHYVFILLLLLIASIALCNKKIYEEQEERKVYESYYENLWQESEKARGSQIDAVEWELVSNIPEGDTNKVLEVSYKDELGLHTNTIRCAVVWKSKKTGDYKCTAPWISRFKCIKNSNILDFEVKVIDRDSAEEVK